MRNKAAYERWWIWLQNLLTLATLASAPLYRGIPSGTLIAIGGGLILCGAVFGIMGVRALGSNRTPHPEPLPDATFVKHGIYSVVRHPLYTSLSLLTIGWSMMWSSVAAMPFAACLIVLLDLKARAEERYLTQRFPEYREYAARVARFLPGIC